MAPRSAHPGPIRAIRPRMTDPRAAIRDKALALGFDAVGFSRAHLGREVRERLAHFLAEGRHGSMGFVVLGLNYGPDSDPLATLAQRDRATISVYARNRDYHDVLKSRLKALGRWMAERWPGTGIKVFVDTAPVAEKPLAQAAGVGWQGKHTNLVSRAHGSWLFLGEVFCTLDLGSDDAEHDHCGSCRACLDACPTDAFPAPYQLDARRCISYLTIEHRGPIDAALRPLMGNRIYGCDDCLAVCPWNKFARAHSEPAFAPRAELRAPLLADLAALDDAAFRAMFSGSPVKRIGRDRFVRNVMIAVGNSADPALRPVAQARCEDTDPVVAEAARWAAQRLEATP